MISTPDFTITHIATALPEKSLVIKDFLKNWDSKYIERAQALTGIENFYRVIEGVTSADLCLKAAENLLSKAGFKANDVDAVIFITSTFDYAQNPSGPMILTRLGIKSDTPCIDLHYGCSGYIYGLFNAALLLQSPQINRCLLLHGETLSRFLDPKDSATQFIFSDAGTATLISKSTSTHLKNFYLGSNGNGQSSILREAGGTRKIGIQDPYLRMNGIDVLGFSAKLVPELIKNVLTNEKLNFTDVSAFVFHQASLKVLQMICENLNLPLSKVPTTLSKFGNSGGPSLPVTLADMILNRKTDFGASPVLLCGFGVGYSWGAVTIDCSRTVSLPVEFIDSK